MYRPPGSSTYVQDSLAARAVDCPELSSLTHSFWRQKMPTHSQWHFLTCKLDDRLPIIPNRPSSIIPTPQSKNTAMVAKGTHAGTVKFFENTPLSKHCRATHGGKSPSLPSLLFPPRIPICTPRKPSPPDHQSTTYPPAPSRSPRPPTVSSPPPMPKSVSYSPHISPRPHPRHAVPSAAPKKA